MKAPPESFIQFQTIDHKAGLKRFDGDAESYTRLLNKFAENQGDAVDRCRAHLANAEPGDAERVLHTLKGIAATIGAKQLHQAAEAAETAVRTASADALPQKLDRIEALMASALRDIGTLLPSPAPDVCNEESWDPERYEQLLARLKEQLEDFDTDASTTLDTLLSMALDTERRKGLARASSAIERYDFETASETIEQHVA